MDTEYIEFDNFSKFRGETGNYLAFQVSTEFMCKDKSETVTIMFTFAHKYVYAAAKYRGLQ